MSKITIEQIRELRDKAFALRIEPILCKGCGKKFFFISEGRVLGRDEVKGEYFCEKCYEDVE